MTAVSFPPGRKRRATCLAADRVGTSATYPLSADTVRPSGRVRSVVIFVHDVPALLTVDAVNMKFNQTRVLRNAALSVAEGERVAVMGPSGSGKSTLLYIALGLLKPQSGTVTFCGEPILNQSDRALSRWRRDNVGIVFQFGHLVQELTVAENVQMPLLVRGGSRAEAASEATRLIKHFGLGHISDRYPSQISGGELQRVAVARAAVHKPRVIFADEPTGALDTVSGAAVLDLLLEVTGRGAGAALVMVTHDAEVAGRADRIVTVKDGRTSSDLSVAAL